MNEWIDGLAEALGERPLTSDEADRLLVVARDVAHRVERKTTPLAAFLLGCAVGRAAAGDPSRAGALPAAIETLRGLLPDAPVRA
jgi:hypothetical protein